MKTIITFCSIWTFFRYDWVIDPGSKIIKSQLKLASLSRKSLSIVSDHFLIMDLFLSATHKGWKESIVFPDTELYAKSFEKNSLKKIKYCRSSTTCYWGVCFFLLVLIDSKGKTFKADQKNILKSRQQL